MKTTMLNQRAARLLKLKRKRAEGLRAAKIVARFLFRNCPRCAGYLGIVLRRLASKAPVRAVNGHCSTCGYRLAWIVFRGNRGKVVHPKPKLMGTNLE